MGSSARVAASKVWNMVSATRIICAAAWYACWYLQQVRRFLVEVDAGHRFLRARLSSYTTLCASRLTCAWRVATPMPPTNWPTAALSDVVPPFSTGACSASASSSALRLSPVPACCR